MHGTSTLPWKTETKFLSVVVDHCGWLIEVTAQCRCYRDPGYSEVVPEELEAVLIERDGDETTCSLTEAAQWVESQWVEWDYIDN